MIIVKIQAGLGNQMFQYAMGKSLALKKHTKLRLDNWNYRTRLDRNYELWRFNISVPVLGKLSRRIMGSRLIHSPRYAPLQHLLRAIDSPLIAPSVYDAEQGFDEGLSALAGSVYLNGCWQSEHYFRDIRELLLKEFTFKEAPSEENAKCLSTIASQNAVCVHVRRGDYVSTEIGVTRHGVCALDYYRAAASYIDERVNNPWYFIFSDDPEWVSSHLSGFGPMTLVSHNVGKNDAEDLRLMMSCKHFIIANSSFSWWAAWLGQFHGKIVVAPKRWYLSPTQSEKDLVPESWIRL